MYLHVHKLVAGQFRVVVCTVACCMPVSCSYMYSGLLQLVSCIYMYISLPQASFV